MPKLSDRLPMRLSCEEGWTFDNLDLEDWLKELAEKVEAQAGRLANLEAKPKQLPVDHRLVEEALEEAEYLRRKLAHSAWTPDRLVRVVDLLRRALEGGHDVEAE